MKTADAVKHFGTQRKLADALGMKQPSISAWGEYVPPFRQLQIQRVTRGKLKASDDVFASPEQRRSVA